MEVVIFLAMMIVPVLSVVSLVMTIAQRKSLAAQRKLLIKYVGFSKTGQSVQDELEIAEL